MAVVVAVFCSVLAGSYDNLIVVDSGAGSDNSSCWNGSASTHPCKTLNFAFEGVRNSTKFLIVAGEYELWNDTKFSSIHTMRLKGTRIHAYPTSPQVFVTCMEEAGLTFVNSGGIVIENIQFSKCGTLHVSTSRNFAANTSLQFLEFFAAFYFLSCRDVSFDHVWITHSHGIAVQMYATVGEVNFQHCNLSFNVVNTTKIAGGGGLYIEFPYCYPGDYSCGTGPSNVSNEYSQNALYIIDHCALNNNTARVNDESNITFVSFIPHGKDHWAFGRGGGLSVFFKGNATNITILMRNSSVHGNQGLWGAGIFVEFQDLSKNNSVYIHWTTVEWNHCYNDTSYREGTGGGGVRLGYIFYNSSKEKSYVHDNHIQLHSCAIKANKAYWGGGLSFYAARETASAVPTNTLEFINCTWNSNTARLGSAVNLVVWHPVTTGALVEAMFINSSFNNNDVTYIATLGGDVGVATFFSDTIPIKFSGYVNFENNTQSALVLTSTSADFLDNCVARFVNNKGRDGGAIQLHSYSFMRIYNNTEMVFTNNSATYRGGAIYSQSVGQIDLLSSLNCFIRYSDIDLPPWKWNARFRFHGNTANKENNSIYATSLLACIYGGLYGPSGAFNMTQVFCWDEKWEYNGHKNNCISEIATAPVTFTATGVRYNMSVFPGKGKEIPARVLDDFHRNITEPQVFGIHNLSLDATVDSNYISDYNVRIYGQPNSSGVFSIETTGPRILYTELNVELLPCPPGFLPTAGPIQCCCGGTYAGLVRCSQRDYTAELQQGGWMGDFNSGTILAGNHPYSPRSLFVEFIPLPNLTNRLDESICGRQLHRTGVLCSECIKEYAPSFNSRQFECVKCSSAEGRYHWMFYILLEFLPLTTFLFIMLIFRISVTNGPVNGFVFFAQILVTNIYLGGQNARTVTSSEVGSPDDALRDVYVMIYGLSNLNFFEPLFPKLCLAPTLNALQLISLGFITAAYPLFFLVLIYAMTQLYDRGVKPIVYFCRPVHQCFAVIRRKTRHWNLESTLIHCFSTFIILSYTKFIFVSFFFLIPASLYDNQGKPVEERLYFNGNVTFLSPEHIPYFIVALLIMVVFVAFLPLLLLVYPMKAVERCSKCCMNEGWKPGPKLLQLLDAFQGCYKNSHRYFAGLYLILRIAIVIIFITTTPYWFLQFLLLQLVFLIAILLFAIVRPYRVDFYNNVDTCIFVNLAAINTLISYINYKTTFPDSEGERQEWPIVLNYILIFCPLLYLVIFIVFKLCLKKSKVWSWLHERVLHNNDTLEEEIDIAELSIRMRENVNYGAIQTPEHS